MKTATCLSEHMDVLWPHNHTQEQLPTNRPSTPKATAENVGAPRVPLWALHTNHGTGPHCITCRGCVDKG